MTGTKANKHRGEVEVKLKGDTFVLRPSFKTLDAIEQALNCSIPVLGDRLERGDCRLREMATVFTLAINDNPDNKVKLTLDKVGDALIEGGGLRAYYAELLLYLSNATSGGHKPDDDEEEGDEKKKEEDHQPQSTTEASSASPSSS